MTKKYPIETIIHVAIILVALAIRLTLLGQAPLSELEASWALQAREASQGLSESIGPQPLYIFFTSLLFSLLDDTNFTARLLPAFLGSLLVGSAFLFRNQLGRVPAIILASGLAFDPGLVAVSRIAGGPMMPLSLSILTIATLTAGMPILGGVLLGMALLSGPAVWIFVLGLGLTLLVLRITAKTIFTGDDFDYRHIFERLKLGKNGIIAAIITFLLVGTGFIFIPGGLGAFANTIPTYFLGWFNAAGVPVSRMIAAYVIYNPLAFIFALIGIYLAWSDGRNLTKAVSIWWFIVLLVVLLNPSRQVPDSIFLIFPTWVLAAYGVQLLFRKGDNYLISIGQAGLIVVLTVMVYFTFASFHTADLTGANIQNWGFLLALLGVVVASTILVGMGWTWKDALIGLGWGVSFVMAVGILASATTAAYRNQNDPRELWYPAPVVQNTDLLVETIGQYGLKQTGRADFLDMSVFFDVDSIRWALRNIHGVEYFTQPDRITDQDAVITLAGDETLIQEDLYRGQDFVWWVFPAWERGLPQDWWAWMMFREAPLATDEVIFWVKADIFADSQE